MIANFFIRIFYGRPNRGGPSRLSRAAAGAARAGRSGSSAAARALRSGTTRARAWRLPAWPDVVWAAVVGGVLGLIATAAGAGAMELFSALRGVSTGGGRWGTLAVLLVVALVLVVGELALRVLRVPQPRAIGFTAICLVLIAILGLFLDVAASMWAWLLLPALGAAAYALATWLLGLGRAEPSA